MVVLHVAVAGAVLPHARHYGMRVNTARFLRGNPVRPRVEDVSGTALRKTAAHYPFPVRPDLHTREHMINEQHLNRLRRLFVDAPSSLYGPEDIGVWAGQARIQFQTEDEDRDAAGTIDRALYFKLLNDAATLAAGSLVDEHFVTCESFDMYVMRSVVEGELVVLAQVVTARGNLFTVEAVLMDEHGRKLARAHGVFIRSTVELPSLEEADEDMNEEMGTAVGALWESPVGLLNLN